MQNTQSQDCTNSIQNSFAGQQSSPFSQVPQLLSLSNLELLASVALKDHSASQLACFTNLDLLATLASIIKSSTESDASRFSNLNVLTQAALTVSTKIDLDTRMVKAFRKSRVAAAVAADVRSRATSGPIRERLSRRAKSAPIRDAMFIWPEVGKTNQIKAFAEHADHIGSAVDARHGCATDCLPPLTCSPAATGWTGHNFLPCSTSLDLLAAAALQEGYLQEDGRSSPGMDTQEVTETIKRRNKRKMTSTSDDIDTVEHHKKARLATCSLSKPTKHDPIFTNLSDLAFFEVEREVATDIDNGDSDDDKDNWISMAATNDHNYAKRVPPV